MALHITEQNNIFLLQGKITSNTADDLTAYFKELRLSRGRITIDIEGVDEIDVSGLNALKHIYESGQLLNQVSITGTGCKSIYQELKGE
ncbi:MAG: STAS domain-containing protein [Flavobacteriaceae bacterium]|nr:STAS domain-containing protein [Bacteroidia bacterium]NNF76257.1 STAS domain-containing protein [Flavobacteriaceae bacterium]NNK74403.1 STAS domain-containing protein [Flavobacteriaceae bacterium]